MEGLSLPINDPIDMPPPGRDVKADVSRGPPKGEAEGGPLGPWVGNEGAATDEGEGGGMLRDWNGGGGGGGSSGPK